MALLTEVSSWTMVAQYNLGFVYANGRGVAKDDVEAMKWYRKAAEQGNENAKSALRRLGVGLNE